MQRFVPISTCRFSLGAVLVMACGAPSPSKTTTTGETDAGDAGLDGDGIGDEDDGDAPLCATEIAALAPYVTRPDGGCSVVVRVDHETLDLLGYQAACSARRDAALDEPAARMLTDCCTSVGTALDPPEAPGLWIFHVAPDDGLGHVAMVSSNVGALVFEATVGRDDDGDIAFPEAWIEPEGLGTECGAVPMPELASLDLVEGGPVAEDRLREVWSVVGTTALPFAMGAVGQPRQAAVLRYPRRTDEGGAFDPSTAEYVVVIEGGIGGGDPARTPDG